MRITRFAIYRLFGLFDHEVDLRLNERMTIIHGPNGFGKTSLLRIVSSICQGSLLEVGKIPFQTFVMNFDDGRRLEVERSQSKEDKSAVCRLRLMSDKHILASADMQATGLADVDRRFLQRSFPFIQQIDEDLWEDTTDGELIPTEQLRRRFNLPGPSEKKQEWFANLVEPLNVKLIETSRLTRAANQEGGRRRRTRVESSTSLAVQRYASELSSLIRATLAQYAERAQQSDQSFPFRLLDLKGTPPEIFSSEQLSARIENLERKRTRLREAGLLERDERQKIPTNIDSSLQTVLSMYIKDVEDKLTSFDDLLGKIELMQQILSAHFSYKRLKISREDGFTVLTDGDEPLDVSRLSSGEQHLLVLVYELLFTDRANSLILIDEPEISLHIEWQLAFLNDLQQIARVANHDVVIATHSPQIVNDRIDLLVPFNRPSTL